MSAESWLARLTGQIQDFLTTGRGARRCTSAPCQAVVGPAETGPEGPNGPECEACADLRAVRDELRRRSLGYE